MITLSLGKVKPDLREKLQVLGIDVKGFEHIIDNFAIRHTVLGHGNAKKEEARGLLPVTLDCLEMIPDIILNPDSISIGGKNKIGRLVILYTKRVNGFIVYVEEIRTKRKFLAMQTMYIKKAPR